MEFLVQTWEDLTGNLITMKADICLRPEKPDLIVAIARGGLSVAHILSDLLDLQVASFTVSSYEELKRQDELRMTFEIGGSLEGRHVLLVDDVSDTGRTFIRASQYLLKNGAARITTAAVFIKPGTEYRPDVFASETDRWIIFPFDLLENLRDISAKWRKEQIAENEIRRRFVEMDISEAYLRLLNEP